MSIIRSPRIQRNFTVISNSVCLDERLSMRGLGVLVRLLSRPDNWETNSETLAREFKVGREQMRSVLRELADAGYMRLDKDRKADGTISSRWKVFDEPQPESGQPEPREPAPGYPSLGDLGPITSTDSTRTENNSPIAPKGVEDSPPTGRILDAWAQCLPELPQPNRKMWGSDRQRALASRWKQMCRDKNWETEDDGVRWFEVFFEYISKSDFLMGRERRSVGNTWMGIDWVLNRKNWAKIIEGNYENK